LKYAETGGGFYSLPSVFLPAGASARGGPPESIPATVPFQAAAGKFLSLSKTGSRGILPETETARMKQKAVRAPHKSMKTTGESHEYRRSNRHFTFFRR
jgi:sulfopyruvate decarboxylase TPP-binding subunit